MRQNLIRKLISKYLNEGYGQGEGRPKEFYSNVLIGPPPPKETAREPRFANEERWDWWRTHGRESRV